ncbi:MAG: MnhB domain-containing protein [bacterium]
MKRFLSALLFSFLIIFGFILIIALLQFPPIGDPHIPSYSDFLPPNTPVKTIIKQAPSTALHYNRNAAYDTGALDIITAIIFDYRGYDTLFETILLFAALIGLLSLPLKESQENKEDENYHSSLPTQYICRLMIPFILMFALSIIIHGHITPGGGFQGGVVIAASIILLIIVINKNEGRKVLSQRQVNILLVCGISVYIGIGLLGLLSGYNFLSNRSMHFPPMGEMGELFSGGTLIWINVGVGLAVAGMITQIFYAFLEN